MLKDDLPQPDPKLKVEQNSQRVSQAIAALKIVQAALNIANYNLEDLGIDNQFLDVGESKLIEAIKYLEKGQTRLDEIFAKN